MLSDAEILLCDEPTTGHDAATALQVMKVLKELAQNGLTVVISIHAPRSDMWHLFDHIALLSRRSVLYSGLREVSTSYFRRCGYEMPSLVSPAEYLVDLAALDTRTSQCEHDSTARLEYLRSHWASKHPSHQSEKPPTYTTSALSGVSERNTSQPPTLMRELRVLTARNMKMFIRDPKALAGAWGGAMAMAVVNGWVFMNMDRSEEGIRSLEGSLWYATELYGYLIFLTALVEIKLFDHERQDGITSAAGFLLSRRASKLLLEDLTIPPCFTFIYYFFAGYKHTARQFFIFLVTMFLSHFNAILFAGLSTAISLHFLLAEFLGNLYFTLQMVAAGYFIPSTQMPVYIGWLRWITHTFYTFGALAANECIGAESPSGVGQFYDCPYSNNPSDPSCKQYTGAYIMDSLGLPHNWIWKPVVILCAIASICYIWAGLILHYNPLKPVTGHAGERVESIDPPEIRFSPTPSPQAIAITLQAYGLKEKGQSSKRSSLLGPISTGFRPGRLTAVMGASGSGKTTLLSALSGRLATSTKARYQFIGSIMYNNTCLPEYKVRLVASLVNHAVAYMHIRNNSEYFHDRLFLPTVGLKYSPFQTLMGVEHKMQLTFTK
ncbi:hypothetical protein N7481_011939 [Penicillium waksmanii]|uniref:uncharacterized protein n=1 Tax=Penicillium waksmanii TaxID=69791 RepID=UPI002547D09E|nr:uncharacterized protein N7481_011939 [Penicillium waksmanii]KAJ5974729.1 hypothetical protein N7481_011939 [Penicillium waksmanii]